jgi:hypothetical protein
MPDQATTLQEAVTKALLGTAVCSALISPPCVQSGADYVPQPPPDKKAEYIRALSAMENLPFDQNGVISIYIKSPVARGKGQETVAERFHRLAAEWSREVQNVSSLTAMVAHPKYRQIVDLGWEVVPFLLTDLQRNKRFWLPALHEITEIQPFDSSDAGNSKRMMNAWIKWGKNKRYIQ